MAATPPSIFQYLRGNEPRFVEELKTLLSFPSVSTQSQHTTDLLDCAEWEAGHFAALGFETEIIPTAKHPVVLAEWRQAPGKPTVLIYGHYDVQPPEPLNLWETPPFEPSIRDGKIYARGASDNKGQHFTHVKALEAWLKVTGSLPLNVIFLLEGEEEIGSVNLEPFVRSHADRLRADFVVISDTAQFAAGVPAITYGLRGIVTFEVNFQGVKSDLHSGFFGGACPNALHAATEFLAGLHDAEGRVTLPGFYDKVRTLEAWEREEWGKLPFDEGAFRQNTGAKNLPGEKGFTVLERLWGRPTLEINGLGGGYQGEGFKTVLPAKAMAKVSMRLVPDQDPRELEDMFKRYVRERVPTYFDVAVVPMHGGKPALVDVKTPCMAAAKAAIAQGFGVEPVMIRAGGSIPIVNTFQELLGAPSLLLGWGLEDDNWHAPNERFTLADFHAGTRSAAALLAELADS